jgi:hypothetical protein
MLLLVAIDSDVTSDQAKILCAARFAWSASSLLLRVEPQLEAHPCPQQIVAPAPDSRLRESSNESLTLAYRSKGWSS